MIKCPRSIVRDQLSEIKCPRSTVRDQMSEIKCRKDHMSQDQMSEINCRRSVVLRLKVWQPCSTVYIQDCSGVLRSAIIQPFLLRHLVSVRYAWMQPFAYRDILLGPNQNFSSIHSEFESEPGLTGLPKDPLGSYCMPLFWFSFDANVWSENCHETFPQISFKKSQ